MWKIISMAILKYVPPSKKIIDKRRPEGGYYVATCEICGTEFYPERSNAKYCTPNCGLIAHRVAVANGTAEKRPVSKPKEAAKQFLQPEDIVVNGANNVYDLLKSVYNTRGDRQTILDSLKSLPVGGIYQYQDYSIERVSMMNFRVL